LAGVTETNDAHLKLFVARNADTNGLVSPRRSIEAPFPQPQGVNDDAPDQRTASPGPNESTHSGHSACELRRADSSAKIAAVLIPDAAASSAHTSQEDLMQLFGLEPI